MISEGDIDTWDWLIDVNADFDEVPIPAFGTAGLPRMVLCRATTPRGPSSCG